MRARESRELVTIFFFNKIVKRGGRKATGGVISWREVVQ